MLYLAKIRRTFAPAANQHFFFTQTMVVYLNGEFLPLEEARVPVSDRGFVFGDGIYEVTRAVDGHFFLEKEHLARLDEGLAGLGIKLDPQVRASIPAISLELLKRNSLMEGESTVYLQVTRGTAWPRTHQFPVPEVPATVYLSAAGFSPHTKLHETGVDVISVSDVRWSRCNLKTVNLLPNVLASQRARDAGVNSCIMIRDGVVTESPNANVFGVKDGVLRTYPNSNYILPGITRQLVIDLAAELQIPIRFMPISELELFGMDELFFSGTTTDIQPIVNVNGKKIGSGAPGPVVRKIQEAFRARLYAHRRNAAAV